MAPSLPGSPIIPLTPKMTAEAATTCKRLRIETMMGTISHATIRKGEKNLKGDWGSEIYLRCASCVRLELVLRSSATEAGTGVGRSISRNEGGR
jgi:hypothetical protein